MLERMFAAVDEAVGEALAVRREGRRRELVSLFAEQARLARRVTQLVREADDDADWRAAGCSSSAQWLAQVASSDHRTAVRITKTSVALRSLPALDHALSTGALTLDQVAAAAEFATPESDAELARVAVGKPPSAIGLAARTLAPPMVADDEALYARRALRMTWTRGRRELCLSGRLPLEHGVVFEQAIWDIAKHQRAADKHAGSVLDWQQSAADALVTLAQHGGGERGGVRRSPTTLIVHLSDDAPPMLEGAGPLSRRDRRTAHLRRTPPHDHAERPRPRPLTRHALCVVCAAARAAQPRRPLPVPRLQRHPRAPGTPPRRRRARRQDRARQPDPALPPTPQAPARPRTSTPAAPATRRHSQTRPDTRSPPTNHTHHPTDDASLPDRAIRLGGSKMARSREDPRALTDETAPRKPTEGARPCLSSRSS